MMKKYEGTVIFPKEIGVEKAISAVERELQENLDRFKAAGVLIKEKAGAFATGSEYKENCIVTVSFEYELAEKAEGIDLDELILGGIY